jgi:hypothetical protein
VWAGAILRPSSSRSGDHRCHELSLIVHESLDLDAVFDDDVHRGGESDRVSLCELLDIRHVFVSESHHASRTKFLGVRSHDQILYNLIR